MENENLIKPNNTLEIIMDITGTEPSECSCATCQSQCKTPCLGTPVDMANIILNDLGHRLAPTVWAAGILIGVTNKPIELVAPRFDKAKGSCTFYTNGKCELHSLGIKPTEGKLSHHTANECNYVPKKSLAWNVAKTWIDIDL